MTSGQNAHPVAMEKLNEILVNTNALVQIMQEFQFPFKWNQPNFFFIQIIIPAVNDVTITYTLMLLSNYYLGILYQIFLLKKSNFFI